MARVKQEWKAQMRSKLAASMQQKAHEMMENTTPPSHNALAAPVAPTIASSAVPGSDCIDLTLDDDSDEDDEPLIPASHPPAVRRSEAEPVESDVDEEWPQSTALEQEVDTRRPPLSFHPGNDEDQESEEDEELPKRAGLPPSAASDTLDGPDGAPILDAERLDEPRPSASEIADARSSTTAAVTPEHNEENTADPDAVDASQEAAPSASAVVGNDGENLEDGEIFEEGAVIASPTKVKQAIALERLASRAGDSETGSPQPQRQKKQKKRGKKKSKRKLEAMMMMSGGGVPDFDRNTRHHPFMPPGPPNQHMTDVDNLMLMYGGPAGFGDHPPLPPPPHMQPPHPAPPFPPPRSGSFPPFADDQILRVNRHGNVETFNSSVDYPHSGIPPQPVLGGFKYRSISGPPRTESVGTGGSTGSSNQSPEKPWDGANGSGTSASDLDLDSLRAAALRTKRLSKAADEQGKSDVAPEEEGLVAPESQVNRRSEMVSPDIDALRAEILRSMMKKKSTRPPAVNADDAAQSGKAEDGSAKHSPAPSDEQHAAGGSAIRGDTQQSTDVSPERTNAVEDNGISPQERESARNPPSSSPVGSSTPAEVTVTPKFRPLTASSQSIVIRLSPEDYVKSSKAGDGVGDGAGSGSTIQSAIDEMRRKIAEKEKLRRESRADGCASVLPTALVESQKHPRPLVSNKDAPTLFSNGVAPKSTPETQTTVDRSGNALRVETTMKNAATRTNLQAKIEEMKKRIAAKEVEKSAAATPSSASSATASTSSSPRDPPVERTMEASAATNGVSTALTTLAHDAPSADDPQKKAHCVNRPEDTLVEEPSSESTTDQVMLQPMGVSDEVVKVVAKDKLEQYQALYHKCVADYEEATNQVATLDDAIATLRTQIAAMESHQVASSSSVST